METIFTVPAVWSDKAKSDTLQCVHQAGVRRARPDQGHHGAGGGSRVHLPPGSSSAAPYSYRANAEELPDFSVNEGDVFITCDAGGGTVVRMFRPKERESGR